MLHAGTQHVSGEGFQPVNAALIQGPILQPPYDLNVYVCPGCFHVQYNLAENDRLRMIKSFIHKRNSVYGKALCADPCELKETAIGGFLFCS